MSEDVTDTKMLANSVILEFDCMHFSLRIKFNLEYLVPV